MRTERLNDIQYQLVATHPETQDVKTILFDHDSITWVTNTVRIAEALDKRNVDIMRNFKNLHKWSYEALIRGCNITPSNYISNNRNKKTLPMWLVDEEAFSVILTSMTGGIANMYSTMFSAEFFKMRDLLTQEQLSNNKLNLANQLLSPSTNYIDHRTDLVEAQLNGQELEETVSMSTFANSLNQTSMIIGRTSLYTLLRDMGLVQHNSCEPTKLGLNYLTISYSRVGGRRVPSSKVKIAYFAQLVLKIQNHYINTFIKNNRLIALLHDLDQLMQENPNMTNDDLISYLQDNVATLRRLVGN